MFAYFELMKSLLTATAYNNAELGVNPALGKKKNQAARFNSTAREKGNDWTFMVPLCCPYRKAAGKCNTFCL